MMRLVQHVYLIFRVADSYSVTSFPVFYTCRRRDWDRVLHVLVLSA